MKDDYLWDKSGEPDDKIQELENVLGAFKYQPRPFAVPESLHTGRRRFFLPMSIAAAIALVMFGTGLWFTMNKKPVASVAVTEASKIEKASPVSTQSNNAPVPESGVSAEVAKTKSRPRIRPRKHVVSEHSEMTAAQRAEGEKAKEQLFIALRLASSKLNQAQKRTQGAPPAHQIRNQHKIG